MKNHKTLFKLRYVWPDGTVMKSPDGKEVVVVPQPRAKQRIYNFRFIDSKSKKDNLERLYEELLRKGSVPLNNGDKSMTLDDWDTDASSCFMGDVSSSGLLLRPVRAYYNHYRTLNDEKKFPQSVCIDILCETFDQGSKNPHSLNYRAKLRGIVNDALKSDMSGEMEYFMMKNGALLLPPVKKVDYNFEEGQPLKIKKKLKYTVKYEEQGRYHAGMGSNYVTEMERDLVDRHINACSAAGIHIDGTNKEVGPGQWEYQCRQQGTLNWADDMFMAVCYLIWEAEKDHIHIEFHPKPIDGINGSGSHFNCSNILTMNRNESTFKLLLEQFIEDSEDDKYKKYYDGFGNKDRLTGKYETSDYNDPWKWGVDDRTNALRIRQEVIDKGWVGPIELRVVSSNANPYEVAYAYEVTAKRAYDKAIEDDLLNNFQK